jgi:hypothetical protein
MVPMIYVAPIPTPEERAARLLQAERLATRDSRRDFVFTCLECWFWALLGVLCAGWAFHTTDEQAGRIALSGGVVIANAGVLQALHRWYLRGEKRGDR